MLTTVVNDKKVLTEGAYQFGKNLVQLYLPAFSSLYFGMASIWNLPKPGEVTGSIALLITFLGVCLKVSSTRYDAVEDTLNEVQKLAKVEIDGEVFPKMGDLIIEKGDKERKIFRLKLDAFADDVESYGSIVFRVVKKDDPLEDEEEVL